jgi:hypothetical protein
MADFAQVLGVVIWPVLVGFVIWIERRPIGALIDALTTRLRGGHDA